MDKRNAPQPELGGVSYFTGRTCCVRWPLFGRFVGGDEEYRRPRTEAVVAGRPVDGAEPVGVARFWRQIRVCVTRARGGNAIADVHPLARVRAPSLELVADDGGAIGIRQSTQST